MSCDSEKLDCFKKEGDILTKEITAEPFDKINISVGIELIVKQGITQKIQVSYGENLIDDLKFEVVDSELIITNENGCDMLRSYSSAKVYITTPELEKIYSSSQYSIHSDGVLTFPKLTLESGIVTETASSIFDIEVNNEEIVVNDNVSTVYKIKGNTNKLDARFWGSNARLEAGDLVANEIFVYHRSANDMYIHPVNKLTGKLLSTGNLILTNVPIILEIEQIYTGHVVYP